jgi:hypothetical protein
MLTRPELIERLEREAEELEEVAARARAEARGKRLQAADLRGGGSLPTPLTELKLTDAVVEVLLQERVPLKPEVINDRLEAAGRDVNRKSIGGTLNKLKHDGRVEKVGRGSWAAIY